MVKVREIRSILLDLPIETGRSRQERVCLLSTYTHIATWSTPAFCARYHAAAHTKITPTRTLPTYTLIVGAGWEQDTTANESRPIVLAPITSLVGP